jgi:hypothetical protein
MIETTIGIDVSKDWLDAHRWPDGASGALPDIAQFRTLVDRAPLRQRQTRP